VERPRELRAGKHPAWMLPLCAPYPAVALFLRSERTGATVPVTLARSWNAGRSKTKTAAVPLSSKGPVAWTNRPVPPLKVPCTWAVAVSVVGSKACRARHIRQEELIPRALLGEHGMGLH
jgi:hypothetical protein